MEGTGPVSPSDRSELDSLFTLAYGELRRLASAVRRGDPSQTLNPTALVHEAWVKLARSPDMAYASPLHFKRVAARAMRQVLVETARRRLASKRDGGMRVSFDEERAAPPVSYEDLLRVDEALHDLAGAAPRLAAVVEGRFFGGLDVRELAEILDVSEATVQRDWRAARAWLGARFGTLS